ncbi:MAG: redoxin domain-containing protein [Chloroflexi bacterium]|nr:redoxin domain-containing protein [Chloroflexota bacterium]
MEPFLIFNIVLLWVCVLLNFLLVFGLVRRNKRGVNARQRSLKIGHKAPAIVAHTNDNEAFSLSDYIGKTLTLIFIAPQCESCKEIISNPDNLLQDPRFRQSELVIISAGSVDDKDFVSAIGKNIPIVVPLETSSVFRDYAIDRTPTYCVIKDDGTIKDIGTDFSFD